MSGPCLTQALREFQGDVKMIRLARGATLFVAFFALGTAVVFVIRSAPNWNDVRTAVAIACLSLVLFTAAVTLRGIQVYKRLRAERDVPPADDVEQIRERSKLLYKEVLFNAATGFSSALLRPQEYIQRITESVDLDEGHVVVSATYTIDLRRTAESGVQYFPIDLIERGVLADGLKLTDHENKRVSSVIRLTAIAYQLAVMRRLMERAGGRRLIRLYESDAERGVANILAGHEPAGADSFLETVTALSDLADTLPKIKSKYVYEIISMLVLLRPWYPLLIDVQKLSADAEGHPDASTKNHSTRLSSAEPGRDRMLGSLGRFQVVQNRILKRRIWNRWAGMANLYGNTKLFFMFALGVYSNDILVPLDNAERTMSYHLQTNGISGTYLGDQHVDGDPENEAHQVKRRQGQNYSRLYVSQGSDYRGRTFQSWFFEAPPGSVATATGVAFASLFGLVLLGVSQLHWISSSSLNAFSLLLGFPGAILGFLGLRKTGGFFRGSIRGRMSNVVSLGAALTGLACAALVSRSTPLKGSLLIASDLSHLPPIFLFWSVLLSIQAFNLVVISIVWAYRVFTYWCTVTN